MSTTFKTKGIVLRTVKYGETSVITTVYTELFGVQGYIVKGVRQSSKHGTTKANYFQPAAMLQMEVYHNELKNLQFVKDYQWSYLYEHVLFNVVKNAAAMYIIELLQHSLKQPEANPELFYLIEDSLKQLDKGNETLTANLPLYFTLHLSGELGFQLQGEFSNRTPILDLREGCYVTDIPAHFFYRTGELAETTSRLNSINFYNDLEKFHLNRNIRRQLLEAYKEYLSLHIEGFGELRSLNVLQEVLG
ncbi:MAG TPA: DNA repair protein RecO [Chitinophagaceae bacterium]|jgi:DNA repair protein RecO (recombination protein O)